MGFRRESGGNRSGVCGSDNDTENGPIVSILKAAAIGPSLGKILDFSAIDARRIGELLGVKWMACNCVIDFLDKLRTLEAPTMQRIAKALGTKLVDELIERQPLLKMLTERIR